MVLGYIPSNMRMNVRPHSLWVAYNLKKPTEISRLLPDHLKLSRIKLLKSDRTCSEKLLFNAYDIDSFFMKGHRLEVVTIAEDEKKMPHFVVLDCYSNTLKWDPYDGVRFGDARCRTNVNRPKKKISHYTRGRTNERFEVKGNLKKSMKMMRRFAVDANHNCFYRGHPTSISLEFDPNIVMQNVQTIHPIEIVNNMWSEYRGKLTHCFMHEQPMQFVVNYNVSDVISGSACI